MNQGMAQNSVALLVFPRRRGNGGTVSAGLSHLGGVGLMLSQSRPTGFISAFEWSLPLLHLRSDGSER